MQAPIIAAQVPDDGCLFASTLKDMNTECRATTRIAFTGSGMVRLLKIIRTIAPNGYTLWSAMARVHLGATPPAVSADAVATAIIKHRATAGQWPEPVTALVTLEYVKKLLEPAPGNLRLSALRPALVADMADLMGKADVGSAATVAAVAFKDLVQKLTDEAKVDAAVALADLTEPQRK